MLQKGQGPILIAGQTASGKSGLALELAELIGGIVVNADSMQVYADLQILTARPSPAEMADVPHRLYGHVSAAQAYSVGDWLVDIARVLTEAGQSGRRVIIVGGTGLYFKALLEGLSPIPAIPAEIREKWRQLAAEPNADLHRMLAERDPVSAQRLNPADMQRLARALEVHEATGRPLSYWQQQPDCGLIDVGAATKLVIAIDRLQLYQRCDERFERMIATGVLDEVRQLIERRLSPGLPAMRALGMRPLAAHLAGELTLADAIDMAKTETRQYAKRQMTWLRGNMITWRWINLKEMQWDEVISLPLV